MKTRPIQFNYGIASRVRCAAGFGVRRLAAAFDSGSKLPLSKAAAFTMIEIAISLGRFEIRCGASSR
jgi:hypothetical protein